MAGWRLRKCPRGVRQLRWQALPGWPGWATVSSQKIVDTARLQFVLVRERNIVGVVNAR